MNRKGIALIIIFIVILILTTLTATIVSRSITESRIAKRHQESIEAFWLAEAGLNRALNELRTGFSAGSGLCKWSASLGSGRYCVDLGELDGTGENRLVTAHGCVPDGDCVNARIQRTLQAMMHKVVSVPDNFYSNAIYGAGDINIGSLNNKDNIHGDVRYGQAISPNPPPSGAIVEGGSVIPDPSINPLARLDFDQLRVISQSQPGNYNNPDGPFPASFWYDETAGIPNVIFLEGNFTLSGNKTIGGFIVVGGEVICDVTLTGNVSVNGAVYTLGNFTVKGGGNALNIDGGVWAGQQTTLTGNAKIQYNATYMTAIEALGINTSAQISSWTDTQNPYILSSP